MGKVFQPLSKLTVSTYSDLDMKCKHQTFCSKISSPLTHKNSKSQEGTVKMNETRNNILPELWEMVMTYRTDLQQIGK